MNNFPWIAGSLVLAVIVAIGFAFWWESDHKVYSGTLVSKRYRAAYTTTTIMTVGKVMIPQTHYHPEAWLVEVQGQDHKGRDGSTEWAVTREYYDRATIGHQTSFGEDEGD